MTNSKWQLDLGANVRGKTTHFKVWLPHSTGVEVMLESGVVLPMRRTKRGYFEASLKKAGHGTLYRYRLNGKDVYPDPCSRYQPEGPFGPSMVVDPSRFKWTDARWPGVESQGHIIYEMHIGAFTQEGTFDAAIKQLPQLKKDGITLLEVMPLADWAGRWNWGYDGVDFYAPTRCYGDAEAFKRFVDAAHKTGLGVILDVVYNHFGPDGNFLNAFSADYVSKKFQSEWGRSPNFEGESRHFFLQNACYWVAEFHLDGLRLDATQSIRDFSRVNFMEELVRRARAAAGKRKILIIAENEPQHTHLVRPASENGYGMDAVWADDFHHSARVSLSGVQEAYFSDYPGKAQDILAAIKGGHIYQGQYYGWQNQYRGMSTKGLEPHHFVFFLQNHDQVANYHWGKRPDQLANPDHYRALTALWLLSPETPLFFMGQEFGSTSPWTYFTDHNSELAKAVGTGRQAHLYQFPSVKGKGTPEPNSYETFRSCKLNFSERKTNAAAYAFHKDLIRLRQTDPLIRRQSWKIMDGVALNDAILFLRYFDEKNGADRLVATNLSGEFRYHPVPEPLLALPMNREWKLKWTSGAKKYGGAGANFEFWNFPARTTLFFTAEPCREKPHG